ncbi:MAG: hypothetical protein ACM3P0_15890 [Acidobacteriota bacterium]
MGSCKLYIATIILLIISLSCSKCVSKYDNGQAQERKEEKPLTEKSLPPGSASIKAWMQEFQEEKNGFLCKVKISEVNGYGSGTPPLPPGYVITLEISRSLLENNKYDAGKIFVKGKLLTMSLRYQRQMQKGNSSERWIATSFSNLTQ